MDYRLKLDVVRKWTGRIQNWGQISSSFPSSSPIASDSIYAEVSLLVGLYQLLDRLQLERDIEDYIHFYNYERLQSK
ncbi:IS3 family transposase [Cohnella algarum]|nr:IS3 family transposase [Cohnella algarum]